MGRARMDKRGRILIPSEERKKLGLKAGTEFELIEKNVVLFLKPVIPKPMRVRSYKQKWGAEAFLDAGKATFHE